MAPASRRVPVGATLVGAEVLRSLAGGQLTQPRVDALDR
jgi:hypothetical protein